MKHTCVSEKKRMEKKRKVSVDVRILGKMKMAESAA